MATQSPPLSLSNAPTLNEPTSTSTTNINEKSQQPPKSEPIDGSAAESQTSPAARTTSLDKQSHGANNDVDHAHPLAQLGSARKHFLLLIFAIATFVDVCNVSGVGVAVAQIGTDTHLQVSQFVWIITSYSLTFAATLLFAGRLSDLFPAQVVFEAGFLLLGIISLVTSFVTTNKFGFLILRGIGGICGAMTIPSSYHLLVHMFPNPEEQQKKLAILGLSGAVGNVLGLVIAGICMLANYRWFFRVMAIICILFSILTVFLLPYTGSSYSSKGETTPRWKRMDIIGVTIMMLALICFILSLTQGPIDGWSSAAFIAPFIISIPLVFLFFFWESRIPPKAAVLPSSVWKITNIIISSIVILFPFSFWATSQLEYATFWQEAYGYKPIEVAYRMLPQGLIGLVIGGAVQGFPQVITHPRISIPVGALLVMAAEVLQVYSDGGHGVNYWKYFFPASIIGSSGAIMCFLAGSINLITYCPPEMAGVAGAWTQVLAQVGGAVTLAVQAGLQTGTFSSWKESGARSFWFMFAWTAAGALQYVIFYKKPGPVDEEHEAARERIRIANGGDEGI